MSEPVSPDEQDQLRRLERRLERERRTRRETERIAEDATRRLYREQIKLKAISDVATTANENEGVAEATRHGLKQLLDHCVWTWASVFYRDANGEFHPVGHLETGGSDANTPLSVPWSEAGQELAESVRDITSRVVQDPGSGQHTYICTINVHGQCYGLIEGIAEIPDTDEAFIRELMEGIAQALGYVFKRERDRRTIERMAYYDALTGLGNRMLFFDRLEMAIRRAGHLQQRAAVIALDIDNFSIFNERAGPEAGDRCLRSLAQRLEAHGRDTDTAARLGGDEFAVVVDGLDAEEQIDAVSQQLLEALEQSLEPVEDAPALAVSAGVAVFPDDALTAEALANCADSAMRGARAAGGARVVVYDPELAARNERRRELHRRVRRAVEAQEFEPHFQPLVQLPEERVVGAEALLRWNVDDAPGPGEFIPILEELGLMEAVGRQVLEQALGRAGEWLRDGLDLRRIAVNVSPVQLQDDAFVKNLDRTMLATGVTPDRVCIEVTESLYLEGDDGVRQRLSDIRARGIRVALDDFGTGYSSLGYLQWMPLDVLKIDKSFVFGLGADSHYTRLVRSIVGIADALGFSVTAEGVESGRISAMVAGLGCTYGQGFFYGRAVPPDSFRELINRGGAG